MKKKIIIKRNKFNVMFIQYVWIGRSVFFCSLQVILFNLPCAEFNAIVQMHWFERIHFFLFEKSIFNLISMETYSYIQGIIWINSSAVKLLRILCIAWEKAWTFLATVFQVYKSRKWVVKKYKHRWSISNEKALKCSTALFLFAQNEIFTHGFDGPLCSVYIC